MLSISCRRLQEQWQLMSAVCLERFPVVTKDKNAIEANIQEMLNQLEFENSHLSDHELRHIEDK